jgi:hypothetical protein
VRAHFKIECSWLRHYATSQKVTGSNPSEVDFFNLPNYSSHTMALGSTQPLPEMSTRNFLGGGVRGGWRVRLTTLPLSVSRLSKGNVGPLTSHNPVGLHSLCTGIPLPFFLYISQMKRIGSKWYQKDYNTVSYSSYLHVTICFNRLQSFGLCIVC